MKETIFINESGLYTLVLSSKLPQAREFKHWVTGEVLPQIQALGDERGAATDTSDGHATSSTQAACAKAKRFSVRFS